MNTPIYRYINIRIFALLFLVMGMVGEGYAQRVYADAQQSSPEQSVNLGIAKVILSQVTSQLNATDVDTTKFSTLSVTLGLLGAITAQQNLRFNNVVKPKSTSPVMMKFSSTGSLLNLLGSIKVQRTNGGMAGAVSPSYSGNQLLQLLVGNQVVIATIPSNGNEFDGVSLDITATLALGSSAYFYYAFYITPPTINSIHLCEGKITSVPIGNFQSGYTYKVYSSEMGGSEIPTMQTVNNYIPLLSSLAVGTYTYWLEAREGNMYPSARTKFTVTVHTEPGAPIINVN